MIAEKAWLQESDCRAYCIHSQEAKENEAELLFAFSLLFRVGPSSSWDGDIHIQAESSSQETLETQLTETPRMSSGQFQMQSS